MRRYVFSRRIFSKLHYRRQRPNQNISFIKVADGPEKEIAEDILERIAAIGMLSRLPFDCVSTEFPHLVWPIMRDNGLGVMTLEDFPPNRSVGGDGARGTDC